MFIFIGGSGISWRLRESTGRPFSRPYRILGNMSVSYSWLCIVVAVVYILTYYVMERVPEKSKTASDGQSYRGNMELVKVT